ncbi:ABC transporter substrate-binding protein [Phytoactinopolyspora limicola]|uniref:ABC transporter substrate-binding protein n=1 Tax=Phytoactinopolyspora limicola TaxID=2715536 RepID=UPI001408878C|nr:ABC transporter substrate-binding protein [Phytoactinopolyspora limicola]
MRTRPRALSALVAIPVAMGLLAVAACTSGGTDGDDGAAQGAGDGTPASDTGAAPLDPELTSFPRDETLFTTGVGWGPPANWNPITSGVATGLNGLVYETLFLFNPETLELEPWLAESGEWTSDDVYEVTLREGIEWGDGEPMTAEDVVFTVELGHVDGVPYQSLWTWLDSAEVVDERTARFTFSDARYGQWDNWIYSNQIVPAHIWSTFSDEDKASGANENPVGSGPYEYHSHDNDRMVWQKRAGWWATEALGLEVKPTYVVDVLSNNEVGMGLVLQGTVDISNHFLPGINQIVDGDFGISTYYSEPPYMLSDNTTMLIPNNTRPPMDDPEFRRALAFAVDTDAIVSNVYGDIVRAANPTGLLPVWEQFYDDAVVDELGFSYDPERAEQTLADAGYADTSGNGFVETPDGDPIELELIVPAGWTDWMEAARVIAENAREAGIDVTVDFPDAALLDDMRTSGNFDLVLNGWAGLSNTPWTYYNYIYSLPLQDMQWSTNFARHENDEAWELVQQLARMSIDDPQFADVVSQLQRIHLSEMPVIPVWHNGLWSQVNNEVWTNWPSGDADTPGHLPNLWDGKLNMGAIYLLTEIELAR